MWEKHDGNFTSKQIHYLSGMYKVTTKTVRNVLIKGTVMQIEKALINDHLRFSKVFRKFYMPTCYNFAVIYP